KISRGHDKCDLSYNDGFYIAKINDGKDIENAIKTCKSDVSSGKSGKVTNAKKYANGLYKLLRAQQTAKFSFVYMIEAAVRDHNIFKKLILNENLPSDPQDLAAFALNLDNWTGDKIKIFSKDILSKEDMSKINSLKKDNEIIVSYAGLYCPTKNIPPREANTRRHYLVQAINWVCALERLGVHNYVIICLDKDTFEKLSEFTNHAILGSNLFVDQKRWLWRKRMLAVNQLIKNGFDVILSDLDAVWGKDPYKEFFSRPEDIVCQNISLALEDQPKRVKIPLEDNTASMFCPGILRIKNNSQTASFWEDKVLGLKEPDDQDALNQAVVNGKPKELFNNKEGVGLRVDNIELFAANLANSKFGIKHSRFNLAETVSKAKKFSDLASVQRCFLTKEAYDYAKKILQSSAEAIKYQGAKLQDKWLSEEIFPGLKEGYYVDIGAIHPVTENNTYILDKELEWVGISINADSKHKNKFSKERTCSTIKVKLKTPAITKALEKLK
ncbi:MAG: putative nucleotide-diphospho-sugar transferase, partial [archaeon]|nr:putative nucleotide-diphospho-sugar transferase [archaeon]